MPGPSGATADRTPFTPRTYVRTAGAYAGGLPVEPSDIGLARAHALQPRDQLRRRVVHAPRVGGDGFMVVVHEERGHRVAICAGVEERPTGAKVVYVGQRIADAPRVHDPQA